MLNHEPFLNCYKSLCCTSHYVTHRTLLHIALCDTHRTVLHIALCDAHRTVLHIALCDAHRTVLHIALCCTSHCVMHIALCYTSHCVTHRAHCVTRYTCMRYTHMRYTCVIHIALRCTQFCVTIAPWVPVHIMDIAPCHHAFAILFLIGIVYNTNRNIRQYSGVDTMIRFLLKGRERDPLLTVVSWLIVPHQ